MKLGERNGRCFSSDSFLQNYVESHGDAPGALSLHQMQIWHFKQSRSITYYTLCCRYDVWIGLKTAVNVSLDVSDFSFISISII